LKKNKKSMKIFGWIFIIIALLNFCVLIVGVSSGSAPSEWIASTFQGILMFGVLGLFLVHKAEKKEKEKKEKDEWLEGK